MTAPNSFQLLLNRIEDFYNENGYYPKVRISRSFWESHAHEIATLAKRKIKVNVVDTIHLNTSFLLEKMDHKTGEISTLLDLKEKVDRWVDDGKGAWPVTSLTMDYDQYVPIQLYAVVPGEPPMEGLELFDNFIGAPAGEHILVLTAE